MSYSCWVYIAELTGDDAHIVKERYVPARHQVRLRNPKEPVFPELTAAKRCVMTYWNRRGIKAAGRRKALRLLTRAQVPERKAEAEPPPPPEEPAMTTEALNDLAGWFGDKPRGRNS